MAKLQLLQTLAGHKGRVWGASWHSNSDTLATCGEDKTIRIWSSSSAANAPGGRTWTTRSILADGHTRTIREVSWSPCGTYLAAASFDGTTSVWDRREGGDFECNTTLEGHENEVKAVAWSNGGNLLATCSRDKSVWIWEMTSADGDEFECAAVLNAHTQDVKKVVWHPSADVLASASYDNTVKVFREDAADSDWVCTATLAGHASTVWSLAFDASGTRLATCSDDRTVKIWQAYEPGNAEGVATPEGETVWLCVCTLSGYHTRSVYDVSWCKQTGLLATACGDDMLRVFRESEGSTKAEPCFELLVAEHRAHAQDVNTCRWHPTQRGLLLSTSDDGEAKLWQFVEG